MSQSQDKSALDVEKAQPASSDTASIFSTSSFSSTKALLKKYTSGKTSKPDTEPNQDELLGIRCYIASRTLCSSCLRKLAIVYLFADE
ncbi:hypothetical protein F4774DRAFT_412960 [Daldinia eschscholtzii]|nr:hypothetical protein F4774DRAFT_412960 [Daldinia eschscholtzii]